MYSSRPNNVILFGYFDNKTTVYRNEMDMKWFSDGKNLLLSQQRAAVTSED